MKRKRIKPVMIWAALLVVILIAAVYIEKVESPQTEVWEIDDLD